MTEPNEDRILNRIRKMLALANDAGATEGERDNALRMAHATLAKYNLDIADAEAAGKPTGEPRIMHTATFYGRPWARTVVAAVSRLFFCKYVYGSATKGKETRHHFVGKQSNALSAAEMAQYLVESIAYEARRRARAAGEGNTYLRSFALGAGRRLGERVHELMTAAAEQKSSGGTAIVLRNLYQVESEAN